MARRLFIGVRALILQNNVYLCSERINYYSFNSSPTTILRGFTVQKGDVAKRFLFFICVKSTKNFLKKFCSSKSIRIFAMSIRD